MRKSKAQSKAQSKAMSFKEFSRQEGSEYNPSLHSDGDEKSESLGEGHSSSSGIFDEKIIGSDGGRERGLGGMSPGVVSALRSPQTVRSSFSPSLFLQETTSRLVRIPTPTSDSERPVMASLGLLAIDSIFLHSESPSNEVMPVLAESEDDEVVGFGEEEVVGSEDEEVFEFQA